MEKLPQTRNNILISSREDHTMLLQDLNTRAIAKGQKPSVINITPKNVINTAVYGGEKPSVINMTPGTTPQVVNTAVFKGEKSLVINTTPDNSVNVVVNQRTFKCALCRVSFRTKNQLISHRKVHQVKQQPVSKYRKVALSCPTCNKTYPRWNFDRHMKTHDTFEKAHTCSECLKAFSSLSLLNSHREKDHSVIDQEDTLLSQTQEDGMQSNTEDCTSLCEDAASVAEQGKAKVIHIIPDDVVDQRIHKCTECGISFRWEYQLSYHAITHKIKLSTQNIERPWECTICGGKFQQKRGLTRHLMHFHPHKLESIETYECSICGAKFDLRKGLTRHMKRFHKDELEQIQCKVCCQVFETEKLLKEHNKTHNLLYFSCDICSQVFES